MASFRERLVSASLESVIGIAIQAAFSGALITAIIRIISAVANIEGTASFWIAIALGLIAGLIVLLLLLAARRRRVIIPYKDFSYSFDLRRFSINYYDRKSPIHKRRYIVRSHVDGLDRLQDAFCWTGEKADLPICTVGDCEVRPCGKSGLFTVFEAVFPRKIGKGQVKDIELTWNLDNSRLDAQPFLSMTVTQPTNKVEFEANLPDGSYRGPAFLTSCPHIQVLLSDDTEEVAFNDGHAVGVLNHPRLYSHNELRWRWA